MTAVRVGSHTVEVSNADKVLFPDGGITKGDVVDYYRRIADHMVPHLEGRPLALHRFPDGIKGEGFFQKSAPDYFPDWIETVKLERERGGTVEHVVCNDAATLVYLADQAALMLHRLLVATAAPRKPVEVILDLDPAGDDPPTVRLAARILRDVLDEKHVTGYVKSTGSKGLHVHIPLKGSDAFDDVRAFAKDLARSGARGPGRRRAGRPSRDPRSRRELRAAQRDCAPPGAVWAPGLSRPAHSYCPTRAGARRRAPVPRTSSRWPLPDDRVGLGGTRRTPRTTMTHRRRTRDAATWDQERHEACSAIRTHQAQPACTREPPR
jgi:bifunctional non-homologous end joining protein LigD